LPMQMELVMGKTRKRVKSRGKCRTSPWENEERTFVVHKQKIPRTKKNAKRWDVRSLDRASDSWFARKTGEISEGRKERETGDQRVAGRKTKVRANQGCRIEGKTVSGTKKRCFSNTSRRLKPSCQSRVGWGVTPRKYNAGKERGATFNLEGIKKKKRIGCNKIDAEQMFRHQEVLKKYNPKNETRRGGEQKRGKKRPSGGREKTSGRTCHQQARRAV